MNNKNGVFFREQFDLLNRYAERDRKDAMNVHYKFSNNLLLVASIIIAFSSPLFTNSISDLNLASKILLFSCWISLFISIIFGLIQYHIDNSFFNKHFDEIVKYIQKLSKDKYKTPEEFLKDYSERKEVKSSNSKALITQVIFLILGLILLLVFLVIIAFFS